MPLLDEFQKRFQLYFLFTRNGLAFNGDRPIGKRGQGFRHFFLNQRSIGSVCGITRDPRLLASCLLLAPPIQRLAYAQHYIPVVSFAFDFGGHFRVVEWFFQCTGIVIGGMHFLALSNDVGVLEDLLVKPLIPFLRGVFAALNS